MPVVSSLCRLMAGLLILSGFVVELSAKPIKLRNETLNPPPAVQAAASSRAGSAPLRGLSLIQFSGPLQPEWRRELRGLGVSLLRYAPDDAFVARCDGVTKAQLDALDYVEWVGDYRPDHKLHPGLSRAATTTADSIEVSLLLTPGATVPEAARVRGLMRAVGQESRLRGGTILRGRVAPGQLRQLSESDTVLWIEPAPRMKLFDEVSSKIVAGDGGPNTLYAQSLGYDGRGVAVAVADSGLNNGDAATMHPDLFGRTPAFFHYGPNLLDATDEHSHGTHCAGIIAGDGATGETDENGALYGLGVAPGASIIAQRIFDGFGNYEAPPSFETLTRDARSAGAVIGSNSWGDDTQGRYDLTAMEFDELVRDADALALGDQPYILEFSAGNAGPAAQSIGSPAVAKNVIATGASVNDRADLFFYDTGPETMADFSSRGPCEDGRIKPDVVAPGTWIASLQSQSATADFAWGEIDQYYQFQGGTSQAGPHVSGAAAVFVQFYRQHHGGQTPSPALVKAALINTAVDMDDFVETGPVPNNDEGWGRVDVTGLVAPDAEVQFLDQSVLLTNTQVYQRSLVVGNSVGELKITLTYTDVPGFPGVIPALVNDLDLEAVAPDGTLYRGNQFGEGLSIPNPLGADRINNVEGILIPQPTPGEWLVRVRAHSVVEDARIETEEVEQDFALVISGSFAEPGVGLITLDREAYRAPDQIKMSVVDTDHAGSPSLDVTIVSTKEAGGEPLLLTAATTTGTFTGTVAVASGPAIDDGILQVNHGDVIEARYFDASAGVQRTASAVADLMPPLISNVQATHSFGRMVVSWTTDEPATSTVRYNTNTPLVRALGDSELTTAHSVGLSGLTAGNSYQFIVISADAAGNVATNNNGGTNFSFVALPSAPVLLVDSWLTDIIFNPPPLSGYTTPLDELGLEYDIWDTGFRGSPVLADLQAYRAVIWRVPELTGVWSPAERQAIANYLNGGGALFVASMEILSRLEAAGASVFIQSTLQVQSYRHDESAPPSTGAGQIIGLPNGGVGDGIDILMDYEIYAELWFGFIGPDISDTVTPSTNASPVMVNDAGDIIGLRWPAIGQTAPGRLVMFTFPLDAVPLGDGDNDRTHLMRNVLNFLVPGWSTAPNLTLNSSSYSVPSVVSVKLAGSSLGGLGTRTVTAHTDSDTNGITLALIESFEAGVFDGTIVLESPTNPPAAGRLRAKHGDTLAIRYFDAGAGHDLESTATVDTVLPVITNVFAEAGFEDAFITWETSEPTDALVQFGESALLGRTGYRANFDTSHGVALVGLQPNRVYYYRVVSRDPAGNTATSRVDTISTLLPFTPPWSDNMDAGATNWTTFDNFALFGEVGFTAQWTLGVPNNGVETNAHSPPAAWGCNLNGDGVEFADCYLISPAIYLSGGNIASLTYWHSYTFNPEEILEAATLYIATSQMTQPVPLATYFADSSDGWELAEFNLTPYIGQVVYLIWNYQLIALADPPVDHPGWLVDDVSVTVSTVPPGIVTITNNLWQARYVLTGELSRKGRGLGTTITNAPSGQYTVTFGDVEFYQTPPPLTKTLVAGSNIVFQGNYTFADANSNGVPDAAEQHFFGADWTNRTEQTDSDGDGVPDWSELIAGTDPNNPPRPFRLTALRIGGGVQLRWPSAPGHSYRLWSSANGTIWQPATDWLVATNAEMSFSPSPLAQGPAQMYRVEALPPTGASALAPNLRLTATLLQPGNRLRLRWNSVPDHAYRVLGSSDSISWSPVSDWIHPTAVTASYFVPTPTNGAPHLFRLEVRP